MDGVTMVAMTNVGQPNAATTGAGSPNHNRMSPLLILAFVVSAAILVLVALAVVPALIVPAGQVTDAAKRLELQNSVRTTVLQGIGAVLLVAGAYFTWRQIQLSREQLRQSLDTSTAQLRLSREGQITEQFSRAIEHLGQDKPGVPVGAIYALEQIAKASTDMRAAIHELLAAYVRAESTWPHQDPVTFMPIEPAAAPNSRTDPPLLKIRAPDVQAAITVLGRRTEIPEEIIELQDVDLRCAYLGEANLRRVVLSRAMLAPADLENADLTDAHLRRTNFRGACLTHATLHGADLRDTILSGADLSGADLSEADLRNATCDHATTWPDGFDWQTAGVTYEPDLGYPGGRRSSTAPTSASESHG